MEQETHSEVLYGLGGSKGFVDPHLTLSEKAARKLKIIRLQEEAAAKQLEINKLAVEQGIKAREANAGTKSRRVKYIRKADKRRALKQLREQIKKLSENGGGDSISGGPGDFSLDSRAILDLLGVGEELPSTEGQANEISQVSNEAGGPDSIS